MLTLHRSNRVESLLEALVDVLGEPVGPPTVPEVIAVQSRGMETWLSMELSRRFGIWAGGEFPFPRALVEDLFDRVLGKAEGKGYATESLPWSVLGALPGCLESPGFEHLARYLEDDENGLKAYGLARRIAHALDQYVVYRPEMVLGWEDDDEGGWQGELHRQLVARRGGAHVAARAREFSDALERGEETVKPLPTRVSLFGISTLPPLYVKVLAALPDHVAVHLFLLDATEAAGDAAHPLAESLGGQAREFRESIVDLAAAADDPRFEDPNRGDETTLLARLQSDVLLGASTPHDLAPGDDSLAIHACHGPMREVEVLHDQLRHLLENDHDLEPHDIVVMTPDVEVYAPYVEAVFSTADDGGEGIPFRISDRSDAATLPAVEAFAAVLALARSRVTATDVLDLAATDAVRARFDLDHEDMDTIAGWVRDTRVRWGLDAEHREAHGQPRTALNTWRYGLDRWLLGYAMQGEQLFGGVLPHPVGDAEVLGKFVHLVETLSEQLDALDEPRPVAAWYRQLSRTAALLLSDEGDLARGYQAVRDALSSLKREADDAAHDAPVDLAVVQRHLVQRFGQSASARSFLSGGVTVCNLLPMRSIPFPVVCLLGMGYDRFPRKQRATGFDLVAREPKPGDRSTRADDRYLFLEAVLGARKRLLITYTGQGQRDDADLPPSVLVAELLDAIEAKIRPEGDVAREASRARLITRHPLQPFSHRYFDGSSGLLSYREGYAEGARAARIATRTIPPFLSGPLATGEAAALDLARLQRFYRAPARWFLHQRLGVFPAASAESLEDREPISIDGLQGHGIGSAMVRHAVAGGDLDAYRAVVEASGALPLGVPGQLEYDALRAFVEPLAEVVRDLTEGEELAPLVVDLELGGLALMGQLSDLWPHTRLELSYGKLDGKRRLRHWIDHLALNCVAPAGYPLRSTLVCRGGDGEPVVEVLGPLPDRAQELMADLVELFRLGQLTPLPFFPKSSAAFAEAIVTCAPLDKAFKEAGRSWETSWSGIPGEGDDASVALAFRGIGPLHDAEPGFGDLALRVFEPMIAAREEDAT